MAPRSDAASTSRSSATASPATPCAAASRTPAASRCPTPFGTLYTPNITPDPETGIGKWTADDFWRAMHDGRRKDGSFLYPAFPYTNYTKVTRADSDAIYAFFMSLPPVSQPNQPHELRFPVQPAPAAARLAHAVLQGRASSSRTRSSRRNGTAAPTWSRGSAIATPATARATCSARSGTTTSAAA